MIINADDFGYSKSVNEAICECFKKGVINRTTIMVNMPYSEEAAVLACQNNFSDRVGLHINLTEGRALSKECAESSLCDENGIFKGTFHIPFKSRLYLPRKIRSAIYSEVEAQINKFLEMGFTLRHADSHNYTHSYISVYCEVKKLLKKYGFTSVRISRNVSENAFSLPFRIYKEIFNFRIKHLKVNKKRIVTSKYFCSVQDFESYADKEKIKYDIELMTHPDVVNGEIIDKTLPSPHTFVTKEWIRENELHLEDTSGKKIKLLICFIHVHIGGAMTSLVNFLNALDTEKYDVDVMFYENNGRRCGIKEEINILPQGKIHQKYSAVNFLKKAFSIPYVWALIRDTYYKKIRHNKRKAVQIMSKQGYKYSRKLYKEYDVAIAYEFNWCMNYVIGSVKARKKILWNHVEYEKSGMDFKIDRKALDKADALVFVSEDCKESYVKKHPEHGEKAYFVPNLLASEYVLSKGEQDVQLPFGCNENCIRFLTVARISFEHKGLDRAVMAFSRMNKDGLLKNVKWLIIGDGRDMPRLIEMIKTEGLENCIYLTGLKENPIPYFKKSDVFLLPSRHEGKPMVITESFIMGVVPLVTEYTSAKEQIRHGVDGLVFDNDDEALYQGLRMVLETPEILDELKQNVLKTDYGNEKEISVFDELVEKLL